MIKGVIKVNADNGRDSVKNGILVKFMSDHGYIKVVILDDNGKFRIFNYDQVDVINMDEVYTNNSVKK